jgi:hypothetical protein
MNEAKGSYNGYFRSPGGNKDQFTLRQADEQSDAEFVARVRAFVSLLAENGWLEWNGREAEPAAATPATRTGNSFEVELVQLAAGGEHPRWVVKGGNFLKYGVTCWPETLEAAGIADKLDPLKENKPKGVWIAHYNERQNEEGRWVPDKVLRLERVGTAVERSAMMTVLIYGSLAALAWLAGSAATNAEVEEIPWERAIGMLYKGEVAMATPKEGLELQLILKDGSRFRSEEPHAGAFVEEVQKCGPPCVDIVLG